MRSGNEETVKSKINDIIVKCLLKTMVSTIRTRNTLVD